MPADRSARYRPLIETLFTERYRRGDRAVDFTREDIGRAARKLDIAVPKNLGDLIYSFKFRAQLPAAMQRTAPLGQEWRIVSAGPAMYRFLLGTEFRIEPDEFLVASKIPDATPEIIARYALSDEQALLAKVRYNRLIDVFTGVVCYSLQNHLRTAVRAIGQIETDEVYVGVDRRGAQYVFPVQAKAGRDRIALAQIEQDVALCSAKFPHLICRPVAVKFGADQTIALFLFEVTETSVAKASERHYRLVPSAEINDEDLRTYRDRPED